MVITQEFLRAEIDDLRRELEKARVFMIQAESIITAYEMLIRRIDAPDQEQEVQNDCR